ncbi:MAG: LysM peptidoglycan-binding domain-containing protein, partial [Lachnospiraceae bacterium]
TISSGLHFIFSVQTSKKCTDKIHKIFVEDYVVSYIKQLNKACDGKAAGLALYGKLYEEEGCQYYFLYGASKIEGLEHRGPYLSQIEKEEIEDVGKKYFSEYEFLAWCSVKEDPVEGFFVQAQGKGVAVDGYACFYEKNESMLNYMLLSGGTEKEKSPEKTEEKKAGRGEWTTADYVRPSEKPVMKKNVVTKKTEHMKMAVAAVFLVLCVVGITTLNDYEKLEDLQVAARQVIASITEQKLPDAQNEAGVATGQTGLQTQVDDGVAQESQSDIDGVMAGSDGVTVVENTGDNGDAVANSDAAVGGTAGGSSIPATETAGNNSVPAPETAGNSSTPIDGTAENTGTPASGAVTENVVQPAPAVSYTIVKGDTLISICLREYGSLERMQEICELNGIANADSIQIGQTILLPQ